MHFLLPYRPVIPPVIFSFPFSFSLVDVWHGTEKCVFQPSNWSRAFFSSASVWPCVFGAACFQFLGGLDDDDERWEPTLCRYPHLVLTSAGLPIKDSGLRTESGAKAEASEDAPLRSALCGGLLWIKFVGKMTLFFIISNS